MSEFVLVHGRKSGKAKAMARVIRQCRRRMARRASGPGRRNARAVRVCWALT